MVIYDTKNKFNETNLGTLYLSVMDADYLLKKYTAKELYQLISYDFAETIYEESDLATMSTPLGTDYFQAITFAIENERDLRLVNIVREEVQEGNLYTKSQIEDITSSDAEDLINELLKDKEVNIGSQIKDNLTRVTYQNSTYDLTQDELYKLRTYLMIKHILNNIDEANKQRQTMNEAIGYYDFNNKKQYDTANNKLLTIIRALELMGLSSTIEESDFFTKEANVTLSKKPQ